MRILVTGGAGFIGSHLVEALIPYYDVVVLDNLSTGKRENLPPSIPLYELDLRDQAGLERFLAQERFDVICHLAAQVDVRTSVDKPSLDAEVNILGTLHLLSALRAQRPWVIFASTGGAIYGERADLPISESTWPQPEAPYGIAKLAGELYGSRLMSLYGGAWTTLRLANVYGPRQNPFGEAGVVAIFAYRMLAGQVPAIYGDGQQTRDFVYVGDVVRAFLAVLSRPEQTKGETFNVGTGVETSVLMLYHHLARLTGFSQPPRHLPPKPGELRRNALQVQKLARYTGWQPQVSLAEGLARTVQAFKTLTQSQP